ncbi:MAG: LysR family transcriptional regulator [Kordiimonadales bacterium]|nr:MAG: LysR family transcriptional regulator [Kordiimonadales bacterium]
MIDLNDMALFAKVAEEGGISAAARALAIPKSRVSRRIAGLEETLGVRLLERTTRAVKLTETGALFFSHCKRITEEAESALQTVNQMVESPRGLLRISVSMSVGHYFIAPYLGEFLKLYPEIDIQLDLNNRRVDLISEGYDIVVRVGDLDDSSLMSKKIGQARAHLVASPGYLEQYGMPAAPDDLASHQKIIMSDSNNTVQWLLENTDGELQSVDVTPTSSINDFTALAALVEADGGIAIMPEYVVRNQVEAGRLVRILPDWRSKVAHYYVIYPSRQGLTKKAEAWITFFAEKIKKTVAL